MPIDEDQARVFELLTDTGIKLMLSMAATGVFIAVSIKLIVDPSWPMALAEGFLSYTVYRVFAHYFPIG